MWLFGGLDAPVVALSNDSLIAQAVCERLCCMHDWQDVPFPWELQLFSPPSPPDQRVIHPRGTELMSADRWKLISSFSIPVKSTPNNLPSDLPPSVSSGASLNGLQCLHIVTSCGLAHTHKHTRIQCVAALWFVSVTLAQAVSLHRLCTARCLCGWKIEQGGGDGEWAEVMTNKCPWGSNAIDRKPTLLSSVTSSKNSNHSLPQLHNLFIPQTATTQFSSHALSCTLQFFH